MIAGSEDHPEHHDHDHHEPGVLERLVRQLGDNERSRVATFLRKRAGRRLALADSPLDRVCAVHDFLNAHGLPPAQEPECRTPTPGAVVQSFPAPSSLPTVTLQTALEQRRSHYRYHHEPLTMADLGDLLHHSVRIFRRDRQGTDALLPLSHAPSGGGLNPLGIWVAAQRVEGLDPGIYSYHRASHELRSVDVTDPAPALRRVYGQEEFADAAPVTLLVTADLAEPVDRYGPRHYRTLHADAGVAIQNLYLVATALNLGGCAVSGFRDTPARTLLASGPASIVMALFPVGRIPASSQVTRGRSA